MFRDEGDGGDGHKEETNNEIGRRQANKKVVGGGAQFTIELEREQHEYIATC